MDCFGSTGGLPKSGFTGLGTLSVENKLYFGLEGFFSNI